MDVTKLLEAVEIRPSGRSPGQVFLMNGRPYSLPNCSFISPDDLFAVGMASLSAEESEKVWAVIENITREKLTVVRANAACLSPKQWKLVHLYLICQRRKTFSEVPEHSEINIPKVQESRKSFIPPLTMEDVQLVIDQTGCTEDKAREALINSNGDLVTAIMNLTD
jgi:NACalpha-BTF3-like transcription factor